MAVRPRRVAVIGAGAAGAMAAIFAASGDAETLLLERTPDGGYSLEEVQCLGSCGTAVCVQVNNDPFIENVRPDAVDDLAKRIG